MISYSVDPENRLITTRVAGTVRFAEFADYLQRMLREPGFSPQFDALIIAADAAAVPSVVSLELIKPLVRAWSTFRAGVKWAIVLPDAMTVKYAESVLADFKLSVAARCFLTEPLALEWLADFPASSSGRRGRAREGVTARRSSARSDGAGRRQPAATAASTI